MTSNIKLKKDKVINFHHFGKEINIEYNGKIKTGLQQVNSLIETSNFLNKIKLGK